MRLLKILKPLTGAALIVLSLVGLLWWEKDGRNLLMSDSVMTAARNIERGEIVRAEDFVETEEAKENIIVAAVTGKSLSKIEGKAAKQFIPGKSQVTAEMFENPENLQEEGKSIFMIKSGWIDSRSSSLRKGDIVELYNSSGAMYYGTFRLAYVKDEKEQEVVSAEGSSGDEILQRENGTAVIDHIEIIASLEEYCMLRKAAEEELVTFLIVQKGEDTDG